MELSVYKIDGTESGKKVVLDEKVFGITPNDHVIYLDVLQYLANQRQGTSKTKDRSEVAYSTKKLGRQKGGGGARHGSLKANIFVGGGRVFGPKPRDYRNKLNKKVKDLARKSALTYKMQDSAIKVVEDFQFEAPKTKDFVALMNNLQLPEKKVVLVLSEQNKNVYLSARNLPRVAVVTVSELDTYTIMTANSIVFMEGSVAGIENVLNA